MAGDAGLWQSVWWLEVAWCILEPVELAAAVMVVQDSRMAMRVPAGARPGVVLRPVLVGLSLPGRWAILWLKGRQGLVDGRSLVGGEQGWRGCFGRGCTVGRNCCGVGRGAVGVGTGEPERGSGCRVRVGVVERGGVLERLLRGVPPIGEGKS